MGWCPLIVTEFEEKYAMVDHDSGPVVEIVGLCPSQVTTSVTSTSLSTVTNLVPPAQPSTRGWPTNSCMVIWT